MKIALISDVHGNIHALRKVMEHLSTVEHDIKVCIGDLVGYGPHPNECVELIASDFNYIVMGNHDAACVDPEEAAGFTPAAKEGIEWTQKVVTESNKEILKDLSYGYLIEEELLLVHGSPRAPFAYADNETEVLNGFLNPIQPFKIAFVGHTHVPQVWQYTEDRHLALVRAEFNRGFELGCEYSMTIPKDARAIINVGSVGQPRDNDPRACYAIYDTEHNYLTYYRIPYSIDRTIGKMQQFGFSTNSWLRLMYGN